MSYLRTPGRGGGRKLAGESRPVEQFIVTEEDGSLHPDVDAIEEFAHDWFDFRQA